MILHAFGGMYLDLDVVRHTGKFFCLGPQAHGWRTDPADMHSCITRCNHLGQQEGPARCATSQTVILSCICLMTLWAHDSALLLRDVGTAARLILSDAAGVLSASGSLPGGA